MIRIYLILFIIIITTSVKSNETINLHNNKSLDELVVEKLNENLILDENIEDNTSSNSNDEIDNNSENDIDENNEIQVDSIVENNLENENSFLDNIDNLIFENYLINSNNLKSKVLYDELIDFIFNINFDLTKQKHSEIFFIVIDKLYKTGEITKAYNLIKNRDLSEDNNFAFYKLIEFNFLLSTHQLNKVCELKNEVIENLIIKQNFIEKIDIFCLVLEEKYLEAELQFSLLNEIEFEKDDNFNNLYFELIDSSEEKNNNLINYESLNKDLSFLYSSMMKIGEIPIDEKFYKVDKDNLAISLILNNNADITTRLKAANNSFLSNKISIESLSALYQSVDFDSSQLNNPDTTIKNLKNSQELTIAFYFQLSNIQIFPSARLKVLIDFWKFSKDSNLENIAYPLTKNIISSIDRSNENSKHSLDIAVANIHNDNFIEADKWIQFYEESVGVDDKSTYARFLSEIKQAQTLQPIIDFININLENINKIQNAKNKELFYVLLSVFNLENKINLTINYENIFDDRKIPSIFFDTLLASSIINNDKYNFLFLTIISLNEKDWIEIHPKHLELILSGFKSYNDSKLTNELIIEIFENYKIL